MQVAPTLYVHISGFFSGKKSPDFYFLKTLATTTKEEKGVSNLNSLKVATRNSQILTDDQPIFAPSNPRSF